VAGMSEATIVIESADRGFLITAIMANDYKSEMFLRFQDGGQTSQGCNNLINQESKWMCSLK
jgi:predicted Rossmann fold nucleotide-binding protein DprA/Smf involved in DNA uptake